MGEKQKTREYGIDIMRSLSMLAVVVLHLITHGGLGKGYEIDTAEGVIVWLLELVSYPAVDCFVLISGYLLCRSHFKLSRLVRVWLMAASWSVIIQTLFFIKSPESISIGAVLRMFTPILAGRYWFLNAYIVMMLFSPVLNYLLQQLPKYTLKGTIFCAVAIYSVAPVLALGNDVFSTQMGYSFSWFMVLYVIGGYVRLYGRSWDKKKAWYFLAGYAVLVAGNAVWIVTMEYMGRCVPMANTLSHIFVKYTALPVLGSGLCLLEYFRSDKFSRESRFAALCGRITPMVFAVYLIHDHPKVREMLICRCLSNVKDRPFAVVLLYVLLLVCTIFVVCIVLEWLRTKLFRLLRVEQTVESWGEQLEEKVRCWLKR